eukprot:3041737-Rhodomonas_salina.1
MLDTARVTCGATLIGNSATRAAASDFDLRGAEGVFLSGPLTGSGRESHSSDASCRVARAQRLSGVSQCPVAQIRSAAPVAGDLGDLVFDLVEDDEELTPLGRQRVHAVHHLLEQLLRVGLVGRRVDCSLEALHSLFDLRESRFRPGKLRALAAFDPLHLDQRVHEEVEPLLGLALAGFELVAERDDGVGGGLCAEKLRHRGVLRGREDVGPAGVALEFLLVDPEREVAEAELVVGDHEQRLVGHGLRGLLHAPVRRAHQRNERVQRHHADQDHE